MNRFDKACILSFVLLSDFVMFAQPGNDDGGGGLEGGDPTPAPINTKLILLLALGLVFAFFKIKTATRKA
jgi:hypothetical protein